MTAKGGMAICSPQGAKRNARDWYNRSGAADVAAAKALHDKIDKEFESYGVK